MNLSPETRCARTRTLCLLCLRNLAYYDAGWNEGNPTYDKTEFWRTINGNFFNFSVLDWCKVFGDKNAKHYWNKVVSDPDNFYEDLLNNLMISDGEFEDHKQKMRDYRDKFVAHLDNENTMYLPITNLTRKSVSFLCDHLKTHCPPPGYVSELMSTEAAEGFYQRHLKIGEEGYSVHVTDKKIRSQKSVTTDP